jgi:hypothetical protein
MAPAESGAIRVFRRPAGQYGHLVNHLTRPLESQIPIAARRETALSAD